jgi:hypothetical protein
MGLFRKQKFDDALIVPAVDCEVDWSCPLADGLIGIYLPAQGLRDLCGIGPTLQAGAGGAFAVGPSGPTYSAPATNSGATASNFPATWQLQTAGTLVWRGSFTALPAENTPVWGVEYNAAWSSPHLVYSLQTFDTNGHIGFGYDAGGTYKFLSSSTTFPVGSVCTIVVTFVFSGALNIYLNGSVVSSGTLASGVPGYSGPPLICLGGDLANPSRITYSKTELAGVYSRALSSAEVAELAAEPFAMLRPRTKRQIYSAATPPSGVLTGAASATSSAGGTLTGIAKATGAASVASTATGALAGEGALAGTVAAKSTAAGTLTGSGALAGDAAATGSATGTLTGQQPGLSGTAAAAASASGTLTGAGALGAAAAGASTASGTLTGKGALAGAAEAGATVAGTPTAAQPGLSGTVSAKASAGGTLTGAGALHGAAAAGSTATGTLTAKSAASAFVLPASLGTGIGPQIVAAKLSGATVVLTIQHDGGTDLVVPALSSPHGTAAPLPVQGVGFSVMDGGSIPAPGPIIQAIACVRLDATHLQLTLARAPTNEASACRLFYPWPGEMWADQPLTEIGRGCAITDNFGLIEVAAQCDLNQLLGAGWRVNMPLGSPMTMTGSGASASAEFGIALS